MRGHARQLLLFAMLAFCSLFASCSTCPAPSDGNPSLANEMLDVGAGKSKSDDESILISAAASTKEVVETLATEFSMGRRDTIVKVNAGPSSGLATQIIEGAPADLFLSANREWAAKVTEAGLAERSKALLTNNLVLVVPRDNPAKVKEPSDLLSPRVKKVALASEKVPAGEYADQVLNKMVLLETLIAEGKIARGQDVRGALSFVERGEAEAGIVYSTDARISPNVEVVHEFDPALHDDIVYVLVLLKQNGDQSSARSFFDYLQSEAAESIYVKHGFTRIRLSSEP